MRISPRRNAVARKGTSLVEFAFVAPIFFLFLFGLFEYSRLMFTMDLIDHAAREGARYAVVNVNTATTANVQAYVNNYLCGCGATQFVGYSATSNITVYQADPVTGANTGLSWQGATWGSGIGVTITGTYKPVAPILTKMSGSLTLKGTSVMMMEAN
jgi:Flp pilus assembly protein TadG